MKTTITPWELTVKNVLKEGFNKDLKSQHTPLPWVVGRTQIDGNKNIHSIINADADIETCKLQIQSNLNDIDLIIRAVNMHDELVSDLYYLEMKYFSHFTEEDRARIKDLLKRAKGGA